jgi:hypothetical protein
LEISCAKWNELHVQQFHRLAKGFIDGKQVSTDTEAALDYAKTTPKLQLKKTNDINDVTLPRSGLVQRRLSRRRS